ncbi:MAG: hypothetical protein PVG73_08980 [Desulfobacterales bacterium]|jgi:hypothetical protein
MTQSNQWFQIDHWTVAILLYIMATIAFVNILSRYFPNSYLLAFTAMRPEVGRDGGRERENELGTLVIFSPPLEDFVLPRVSDVIEATREVNYQSI